MSKTQRDIASFLVRFTQDLWQDDEGEPHVEWRGHIRHVQGDDQARFTDFSEAVTFIQRTLMQLTQETLESLPQEDRVDPDRTLQESFKMWERFAASYADMMFGAMEQAIEGSEALRQQMDDSLKGSLQAWVPDAQADPEPILNALQTLQEQIKVLAERVDKLDTTD